MFSVPLLCVLAYLCQTGNLGLIDYVSKVRAIAHDHSNMMSGSVNFSMPGGR